MQDQATLPLANFFKSNYSAQPEVWSRAYRSESHVQAEVRFEEYHKKISRHIYHEGFKRKQLDVLIKVSWNQRRSLKFSGRTSIGGPLLSAYTNAFNLHSNVPASSPRLLQCSC